MNTKRIQIVFIAVCFVFLLIPLFTLNLRDNSISDSENRTLASKPSLILDDGAVNWKYTSDFESWINDNIGLRSFFIIVNARIQYHVFNVLSNNSNMYLGPNGEFNYATAEMLSDYQHTNLYSDEYMQEYIDCFQEITDIIKDRGIDVFYVQCWDKHSIYPEYFPTSVIQKNTPSRTDCKISALTENTDVCVISLKKDLIDAKSQYQTYSRYGDATHWTQRGAYIGYCKVMSEINSSSDIKYRILSESDYNITVTDQGCTLFGGIHKEDFLEDFEIKNPKSMIVNEKLTLYSEDERHTYRVNNSVNNNTRLLIIGDSYFNSFIVDDLAESFSEVVMIWGDYLGHPIDIIDAYDPDIVIFEEAERVDRTFSFIKAVEYLHEE